MKLKIKQLVAWIGGKALDALWNDQSSGSGYLMEPLPVSMVGYIHRAEDDADHRPLVYGKKRKTAYAFGIAATSFSQEPFPLELLLDIMNEAPRLREASYVSATTTRDGYYNLTEHEAAQLAVANTLGVGYPELSRFVYLASYWWNDIEELRNSMKKGENRKSVIEIVEADRPE